jgi:site-specific DNA-methyltransferase (cytosine-N4-specific)
MESPAYYTTKLGSAYLGDALELLKEVEDQSIDLICTSPPFALLRQKSYGNVHSNDYVEWLMQFAREFKRVIKPTGSIVIDIGGTWIKGAPVRSLYHYELVIKLCKPEAEGGCGLYLAQELYWYNPAKLPTPAEWVTVRRVRVKDAVNTVWWLSPTTNPKASNKRVLKPYSDSQQTLMRNGYKAKLRPSEHQISTKFDTDNGGAIPPTIIKGEDAEPIGDPVYLEILESSDEIAPVNVIAASNTSSNDIYQRRCRDEGIKPHPARFPATLPEFIINLCTEEGDLVLEPFAGSNTTGQVAEKLKRNWIAFELNEEYLKGSKFRFPELDPIQTQTKEQETKNEPEVGLFSALEHASK